MNALFCRRTVAWLAPLLLCFSAHALAQSGGFGTFGGFANEEIEAQEAIHAEVQAAYMAEDFPKLELMYSQAAKLVDRTPSGLHKLQFVGPPPVHMLLSTDVIYGDDKAQARRVQDELWTKMEGIADRWAKAYPQSVGPAVFKSECLMRHGFVFRGGGYASSVSPDNMRKFQQYVQQAYQALDAQAAAGRKDPGWHAKMVEVSRLQSGMPAARRAAILADAVTAFPYYYVIAFQGAAARVPQWGGSAEDVEAFAREVVKRTSAREGQALYARIYWAVEGYFGEDPVRNGKADWATMRAGFDDVIKQYPQARNLATFAKFACRANDMPTFRRVLERAGGQLDPMAWNDQGEINQCRQAAGASR